MIQTLHIITFISMRALFIFCAIIYLVSNLSFAQEVEHNYLVAPKFVDCDSLKIEDLLIDQATKSIRASKYRFDQSFRLTRKSGLQFAEFYSCDNESGYLIIKFDDQELLYTDVQKDNWNKFISSSDPEGFYLEIRERLKNVM